MRQKGKPHSRERLKEIFDKAKKERFISFIKKYRIDSMKAIYGKCKSFIELRKMQNCSKRALKIYQKICRDFTELTIINESINIEGRNFNGVHIDHIIPVYHAFQMGISPYLIAMSANLQRLNKIDNQTKGRKQLLLSQKTQVYT